MYTVENLSITEASFPFTWPRVSFSEVATVNTFFSISPRTQYIDISFETPSLQEKLGHLHCPLPLIIHLGDDLTSAHADPQHSFGMAAWCSVMQHTIII